MLPTTLLPLLLLFLHPLPTLTWKHRPSWTSPADILHKTYCYCHTNAYTTGAATPMAYPYGMSGSYYLYQYHSLAYNLTYSVDYKCDSSEGHGSWCGDGMAFQHGKYCADIRDGGVFNGSQLCFNQHGWRADNVHLGGVDRTLKHSHVLQRKSLDPRVVQAVCAPLCMDRWKDYGGLEVVEGQGDVLGSGVYEYRIHPVCKDDKCPERMPEGVL